MKQLSFAILLVFLNAGLLVADQATSGLSSFFLLGAGARAVGMGGSFVSVANDASAVFWNPAGLPRLSYPELTFAHVTLPEGSEYDFGGIAYPTLKAGSFSAGFLRIGTDGIFSRDNRASDLGEVSFSQSEFLLGYGYPLFRFLKLGASAKLYNQSLAGFSATAVGTDVGVILSPVENLSFGLNVQDIVSSDLTLKNSKESIPRNFKAGVSHLLPFANGDWSILAAFDVDKSENTPMEFHAGGELSYLGYFFLRGGYDRKAATFGGGLAYHRVGLDYAFKSSPQELSASHRVAFTFRFGSSTADRERKAREEKEQIERENYLRLNRARLDEYRGKGENFISSGQKDSALAYYRLALGIDPENEDLKNEVGRLDALVKEEKEVKEKVLETARVRSQALESAQRDYVSGRYKSALNILESGKNSGDLEFVELSGKIKGSLDSAKQAVDSMGWAAFRKKEFDQALVAWKKLSELDSQDSLASNRFDLVAREIKADDLFKQGISNYESGRLMAAEENFKKVLERRPSDPVAASYLQKIHAATAQKTTLEDLKKDPQAWRLYNQGRAAYTTGDYQKALAFWQELALRYPNNEALLRNIAEAKKRLK